MNDLIFSVDAETNGLYGDAFAIGVAIFTKEGRYVHEWHHRCSLPSDEELDPWVKEHVVPHYIDQVPIYSDYAGLLQGLASFYQIYRKMGGIDVICHMGVPVEAKLFIDMRKQNLIGDMEGPYPLIDISAYPEINTSVDTYAEKFHIINGDTPPGNGTHDALYDAWITAKAYIFYNNTFV